MSEAFLSLELQMSLLLFFALIGYILASRINQSAIIGLILVGLLIGPSFLGLIQYSEFIQGLAHVGIVVLLFVIGLEFKITEIMNPKYFLIAIAGVVLPWVSGYFLASAFGYPFPAAVFVGTALTATSIAITANVLKEMGKLKTEVAKAIIGAAVIDDILGLMSLSLSIQLVAGSFSYLSILLIVLKSVGFLVLGTIAGFHIFNRLIVRLDRSSLAFKFPEIAFILTMAIAFLYAAIAELIGLSAIVGSFIAGISLGGIYLKHSKDFKQGAEFLYIIFASVFFISLGILTDLKFLTLPTTLFLSALVVVAVLTKVIGCGLAARLSGLSKKDSLILGFGMSPRGEVAMVIALIGLNQGLFGQEIYISIVLMALITTILTPIVLKTWFYRQKNLYKFASFKLPKLRLRS